MSKKMWLGLGGTAALIAAAFWFRRRVGSLQDAAWFGDYWSAVAATLAFVWLIAGFFLQSRELELQRRQLKLQRQELRLQRVEMQRMAEQATLGQVATMLSNFNLSVPAHKCSSGGQMVGVVQELPLALVTGIQHVHEVFRGSVNDRFSAYRRWSKIEGVALQFLGVMVAAIRLYSDNSTTVKGLEESKDDAGFVLANLPTLRRIPHIQLYVQQAEVVARTLDSLRDRLLRVRLAGWIATNEVIPSTVSLGELEILRAKVAALGPDGGTGEPSP